MNYCLRGRELMMDLKRSEWLPSYDEEAVRTIIKEIGEIAQNLEVLLQNGISDLPEPQRVAIIYQQQCLKRNFLYLDGYFNHRASKIRRLRWEAGGVLPERLRHDTLSMKEKEYFMSYSKLLGEYNNEIGLDLTADLEVHDHYTIYSMSSTWMKLTLFGLS